MQLSQEQKHFCRSATNDSFIINQIMNKSSTAYSDAVTQILNETYLKSDNKPLQSDVLRVNQSDMKLQFKNELSMIQNAKDQVNSGLYLSNLQKERSDQFDMVLAQRRYLWNQEEKLYKEIDDLRSTNQRYKESMQKYGIKNQNLEKTVDERFQKVSKELADINKQRSQVLQNFSQIQQNIVPSKSKLSSTGSLIMQGNDQYRMLVDYVHQKEKQLSHMKQQFNDPNNNQIIPFDKKIEEMAENTFEKQARYLYNGTKFEGNEVQKIQALGTLRRKIEQHIENRGLVGVLLDMPFKVQMTKEQENVHRIEYNNTITELEDLRQEYIQSGGTDPNYLISLNNLERHYRENHPLNQESLKQQETKVNLQERGKIVENPIFKYLPETFKQEILELENEVAIKKEADKNDPLKNTSLMRPPVEVGDSSKADENMLEHLRQQEAELFFNRNVINKAKYDEIQRLKQIYEKRYLEKRVQEELAQKQIDEDVMNQRTKATDKQTYLKYLQGQINTMPLFYDPDYGLVIRFDYVSKIPVSYDYVKLTYGIFVKETETPIAPETTGQHQLIPDGINSNKGIIQERFLERGHPVYKDTYLYIILWGFSSEFGGNMVPVNIGWSLHKLFNEETLISGCYLIPFYNASFTFEIGLIPEVYEIRLGMRICTPGDAVLDITNRLINEQDYHQPAMHDKDMNIINLQRQFNFKQHNIFALPPEFIEVRTNKLNMWNSVLPPNVYKLQSLAFLNDAQALYKKQLEDFEARSKERSARRRFGPRKTSQKQDTPSEGRKTIIGGRFRRRPGGKNETSTPRMNTSRAEKDSHPESRSGNRSEKRQGTHQSQTKERYIMFKLRALSHIYTSGIQSLVMKLGLFCGPALMMDDQKKPCLQCFELEPDEKGTDFMKFTVSTQFMNDINDIFEDQEEEEIMQIYIYILFFKEGTTLFGWAAIPVFEKVEKVYRIKSGIYYENLFAPPGQAYPINMSRAKRMNTQMNFILMQDDDRIIQLPQFDNYVLDHKLQTEEDEQKRKKIYSVANPKWNTQIKIDLNSVKNFKDKVNFIMKLVVVNGDEVIIDAIERQCIRIDPIELFENIGKELIANHSVVLRIGSRYLADVFPLSYKKLVYLFSFYNGDKLVGVAQFPIFSSQGLLNLGTQRLVVHELDAKGAMGKKTTKEINIFIYEENLNLKDIEETPKYAKQNKDDKRVAPLDKQKCLIITLEELTDYIKSDPVDFTVQIYKGKEPCLDLDNTICVNTSANPFYPKSNNTVQIRESVQFKIPINSIIDSKKGLDEYQVFISFQNVGWYCFPLFLNGLLNSEDGVVAKLYNKEVPAPPVDYAQYRKVNTKVQYSVQYDFPPLSEAQITGNQKSQEAVSGQQALSKSRQQIDNQIPQSQIQSLESLHSRRSKSQQKLANGLMKFTIINVTGFEKKGNYFVKGIVLKDTQPLKDQQENICSFSTAPVANNNRLLFFKGATFEFAVDAKQLTTAVSLFLQVLDENKEIQGWQYKKLVIEIGKINAQKYYEKLFAPPIQKPPIDEGKLKTITQTIQFEVQ